MIPNTVSPSLPQLCRLLQVYLRAHPLFANGLVFHPLTKERVYVNKWRMYPGFLVDAGLLTCSVYPYSGGASPNTKSASATYGAYDLGHEGHEEATYHVMVDFGMLDPAGPMGQVDVSEVDLWESDPYLTYLNSDNVLSRITGIASNTVEIHPPREILGEYVELTRLAINDMNHRRLFQLNVRSMEMVNCQLVTMPWEKGTSLVLHQGLCMLKIVAYVARTWRPIDYLKEIDVALKDGVEVPIDPPTPPQSPLSITFSEII